MLVQEFRVTMPMTVEEYQVAQLYSVAEASKNETGGGEGVEVLRNEPFTGGPPVGCEPLLGGKFTSGQYTHKVYHLGSKVPKFVAKIAPTGSLEVHEEAWNAYPYCRTIITNKYMDANFELKIETYHIGDDGHQENVHNLPEDVLKQRKVVHIDIAHDPVSSSDYKPDEDPKKYKSEKTGRGPLVSRQWTKEVDPVMTCYKLVTARFKWFGLQNRMEAFIMSTERRLFTNFHRQVFCWTDKWHGMTMEDIRALEDATKDELEKQRRQGGLRGTRSD